MPDNAPVVPAKNPLLSKTLWTNLILAILGFLPEVSGFVSEHPEAMMLTFGAVNFILRLVTKQAVSLQD